MPRRAAAHNTTLCSGTSDPEPYMRHALSSVPSRAGLDELPSVIPGTAPGACETLAAPAKLHPLACPTT